jgi:hypothetical protein
MCGVQLALLDEPLVQRITQLGVKHQGLVIRRHGVKLLLLGILECHISSSSSCVEAVRGSSNCLKNG